MQQQYHQAHGRDPSLAHAASKAMPLRPSHLPPPNYQVRYRTGVSGSLEPVHYLPASEVQLVLDENSRLIQQIIEITNFVTGMKGAGIIRG
jgi:hypothetical protein